MKRLVFDSGPFLLTFTKEKGSDTARDAISRHEKGDLEIYMHPNNLAEAYRIISMIRKQSPPLMVKDVKPEDVIKAAYANLNVLHDYKVTIKLGFLKLKYAGKPWGDLSSAALSLALSNDADAPVVILDNEMHFGDIKEVKAIRISDLANSLKQTI